MDDAENQKGLRILYQAYSGNARVRIGEGQDAKWVYIDTAVGDHHINRKYNEVIAAFIRLKNDIAGRKKNRQDIENVAREREQVIYEQLFEKMDDPAYQKALILRMLTPNISDAVVNIRNSTLSDKAVSKDYFYKENMLNEPVMSLMAKISTGERNGNKTFAKEVLRDLNNLKNVAYLQTRFPNANRELLLAKMYTEPASLEGSMTKDLHLGQKVYEAANAKDEILRNAAKFIIDAAQSKGLVDPVLSAELFAELASIADALHLVDSALVHVAVPSVDCEGFVFALCVPG